MAALAIPDDDQGTTRDPRAIHAEQQPCQDFTRRSRPYITWRSTPAQRVCDRSCRRDVCGFSMPETNDERFRASAARGYDHRNLFLERETRSSADEPLCQNLFGCTYYSSYFLWRGEPVFSGHKTSSSRVGFARATPPLVLAMGGGTRLIALPQEKRPSSDTRAS